MKYYSVYKGLQKPLIFKGFKGRYIFWGIGSLVGGLVTAGIVGIIFNIMAGLGAMAVVVGAGLFYTSQKQKKGLYDKKSSKGEIYIMDNRIKNVNSYRDGKKEEHI